MAVDTKQKRMSAINMGLPFRRLMVDPDEVGFTQGNRQAALTFYSGILATVSVFDRLSLERGNYSGVGTGILSGTF